MVGFISNGNCATADTNFRKTARRSGIFSSFNCFTFFFQFCIFQVRGGTIFLCQLLNLTTADCSHSFGFLPSLLTFHRFCSCFDSSAPVQQVFSFLFQRYRRIMQCWMWNWPSSMLSVISKVPAGPRHIYGSDHPKIGFSILSRAFIRVMSFSLWRLGHFTGFEYFVSSGNQFVDKVCCLGGEEEELYMSRKKL